MGIPPDSCAEPTILKHVEAPGVIQRAVVLPRQQLTMPGALILAKRFLEEYGPGHRVSILLMGANEQEVRRSLYHYVPSEQLEPLSGRILNSIAHDIDVIGPPKEPIARLVSIGDNSVVEFREGDRFRKQVVHGRDPTVVEVGGTTWELLHISVSKGSEAVAEEVRAGISMYFRSGARPSVSHVARVTERLKALVGTGVISVLVRPSGWFLDYSDYPLYPAFARNIGHPNVGQYQLEPYVTCASVPRRTLNCSGRGFEP